MKTLTLIVWSLVISGSTLFALEEQGDQPDTSSLFDSSWSATGFVIGYGEREAYVKYACGGTDPGTGNECDGPPEEGLIARFANIADNVLGNLGVDKCADISETGSETVSLSGTFDGENVEVTFAEPQQTIPENWDGGGNSYDRRLEFTADVVADLTIKMVVEMSCSYPNSAMAAMNMEVGNHAPGYERPINIWVGKVDGVSVADIYVSEVNSDGYVRGAYAYSLKINDTAKTYQIWGVAGVHYSSGSESVLPVDVYNLAGSYEDHTLSIRVKRYVAGSLQDSGSNDYMDINSLESISDHDVATLEAATSFDLLEAKNPSSGTSISGQGCMDFDTATTAPTNADLCDGLDLETAPTPVIDDEGSFSASWTYRTMRSEMEEIPTL